MDLLLDGIRVLDLSSGVAGPWCTHLLAAMGADVLKVEPPGGDATRRRTAAGRPVRGESELFACLNASKASLVLDLTTEAGRRRIEALVPLAHVVVDSFGHAEAARLSLTAERFRALSPPVVHTALRNFPAESPERDAPAANLTLAAASGFLHQLGEEEREPLCPANDFASYVAGLAAAVYTCAALRSSASGRGVAVELPISHLLNWIQPAALAQLALLGHHPWPRRSNGLPGILACSDGYAGVNVLTFQQWESLLTVSGIPEIAARPELQNRMERNVQRDLWMPAVVAWVGGQSKGEVLATGQAHRMNFAPVIEVSDMLAMAQHRARGFFQPLTMPGGERIEVPGSAHISTATGWREPGRVPAAGAGGEDTAARWSNEPAPGRPPEPGPAPRPQAPLAGIRVLELGAWWSIATAATVLGGLGAEVIKIEPPAMDGWRLTAVAAGAAIPWERGPMFTNFNLNKKGLVLDLAQARGKDLFLQLVDRADVVVENFSPRVMPNLGLDYAALAARNSRVIMVSVSGYGASGPWRDFVAHGLSFEQASGFASLTGYRDDGLPRGINAYSDPIIGHWAAMAVCSAIEHRRRTGRGQWFDVSAFEVLSTFLSAPLAAYQLRGELPQRTGNRHPAMAPHGVYPCAGEDSWVAIAVQDDAGWASLRRALGDPAWAGGPALATLAGRKAAEDVIDAALAEWTAGQRHTGVAARLLAAGVAASAVWAPGEQLDAPGLGGSGMFAFVDRPVSGNVAYPRLPVRLDGEVPAHVSHAPLFGEHNRELLSGLLGLSAPEIDALYAAGVTCDRPRGY